MNLVHRIAIVAAITASIAMPTVAQESPAQFLARANAKVARSMAFKSQWDGPVTGPAVKHSKGLIVFIASDFKSVGVSSVAAGVKEAAGTVGWSVHTVDTYNIPRRRLEAFSRAMALRPTGIILAGFDAADLQKEIAAARNQKVAVVGWHASAQIGPADGLFTNVGSDPKESGQLAALLGIVESKAKGGILVLADNTSAYAAARTNAIIDIVKQCQTCTLLGTEPVPANETERATHFAALLTRHGSRLNYAIGANDQHFDAIAVPSMAALNGAQRLQLIAAGDGISSAYQRINSNALQIGTVPEPLNMQGWQLVDEINRSISNEAPSGYTPAVYLVTRDNKAFHGGPKNQFEPSNGYRDAYRRIWLKK